MYSRYVCWMRYCPNSNWAHTESGYFEYEHLDSVPNCLANFKTYGGVYITLNPVNLDLLARAQNRLKKARSGETTSDGDILHRRWLLIDVDAVRPSGISATDAEKELAFDKMAEIQEGLASMNWPRSLTVDSGNGYYLMYRIDLPASDEGLIQRCLQALKPVSTDKVRVDLSVFNAARICRLPGTWNRKGDSLPHRPHRIAEIVEAPEQMSVVSTEMLHNLAGDTHNDNCETHNAHNSDCGAHNVHNGNCETHSAHNDDCASHNPPPTPLPSNVGHNIPTATHNFHDVADDFNRRGDIAPILEKHGWTLKSESGQQYWWRPGKSSGQHSATFDGQVFYPFTDNAEPFTTRKGYSRFGVYAQLEHNGDYAAALSTLASEGYGNAPVDVDISGIVNKCSPPQPEPRKRRFTRFDQLEIRPPQWLLRGILEKDSTALIFGDPGAGKSFVAVDWACRIASGTPWRGRAVKPAPVAYLLGEGQGGLGRRVKAWETYNNVSLENAQIYNATAVPLPDRAELESLMEDIEYEIGKPELVVFDTLARNFGGGDENSTQDMNCFVRACDIVREKFNCTILIIHHTGHGDKNRARGAMALKAALDAEYCLTKQDRLLLSSKKMKDAEPPDPITLQLHKVIIPEIFDEEGKPVTSAAVEVIDPEISGIVAQAPAVPLIDFVENCIKPYDPCPKHVVQYHAERLYRLPAQRVDEMLEAAVGQGQACRVGTSSGTKYIAYRAGFSGEKSLWVAALLSHDQDANTKNIADEVGVTRQYVNQVRRKSMTTGRAGGMRKAPKRGHYS